MTHFSKQSSHKQWTLLNQFRHTVMIHHVLCNSCVCEHWTVVKRVLAVIIITVILSIIKGYDDDNDARATHNIYPTSKRGWPIHCWAGPALGKSEKSKHRNTNERGTCLFVCAHVSFFLFCIMTTTMCCSPIVVVNECST